MDDESWEKLLSDLEMDNSYLLSEYNMNSVEEELINGENSLQLQSENTYVAANNNTLEENTDFFCLEQVAYSEEPLLSSSMSSEQSIEVPNNTQCQKHYQQSKQNQEKLHNRTFKRFRSSSQIQDHIIAERKRRENLTKLFIALSAIIPGLKKMDKASIITNTIHYVKCLQKSVKDLEEQTKKRKTESMACFKNDKSSAIVADDSEPTKRIFPIVEARVSSKDVLIRVMCENRKHILIKLLTKLEAHNLSVVCSNVLPFGNSTLDITIIAQVDHEEFSMTMDDLVKNVIKDLSGCCDLQQ